MEMQSDPYLMIIAIALATVLAVLVFTHDRRK